MWNVALSDPTPPLYYAVLHFTMRFLGDTPALMRIPSVVFGMLILPLVYWCMRQGSFRKMDGLYAVLLVSVSSMLVYYSQELRAYIMLAFLGVLSVGLLLRCLRNPTLANNLFYAVAIFIMSYTHHYGLFLLAAQILCIILYRRWQTLLVSLLTSALIALPLFLRILQGKFNYSDAIDRVTNWGAVIALINMLNVGTIDLITITEQQPGPHVAYQNFSMNLAISIVGLVIFLIIFLIGLTKLKGYAPEQRQFMVILGICIVVPVTLALLAGSPLSPRPQWLLRGLIYIWPLYYMLAVVNCSKSRFKGFFIAIIVLINCLSLYPYYTMFSRCKEATALEQLNSRTTNI
ncbi:MAG: glycosyltransferase family 39 protein [Proteobacteria bacterium]|nr:glycosyltransferase family 39 protein [Pseudomonadota bacterium]